MDGIKGYITNTDLPAKEVISNYRELWHIERAFRISKTDLQIRPIFHRLRNRIEAHVCISFMAYLIYKEFERLLHINNLDISVTAAIEQINKIFEILIPDNKGDMKPFRPANNPIQQKIEDIISLPRIWVPLAQNRKKHPGNNNKPPLKIAQKNASKWIGIRGERKRGSIPVLIMD